MGHCLECALPKSKKGKEIPGKIVPAKEGSCFCEECQPVRGDPAVLRYGYFIPLQDRMCGDLEYATEARETYVAFGFPKSCDHATDEKPCKDGESCKDRYYKFAGRMDGVSIFQRMDGTIVKRTVLQGLVETLP